MLSRISLKPCQLVILLHSVKISTVSCDTFYIVTSPSSPCPGEYIGVPCLTLQQYASNPSRSQNITFITEPGMYNLSTVLTVSNGYNFTMSSTNATVTCTSATAKFEFNRVQNVHISGIIFQWCQTIAISMSQVTSTSIESSNFLNNRASSNNGGYLYIVTSSIIISESEFRNNRAYYRGGAIYASSSIVSIKRSQFSYNTQDNWNGGGAICASSSNITVNGSVFAYNSACSYYSGGGAIYTCCSGILQVMNTTFIGNRAYGRYRSISGGAISTTGLSATVIQCRFISNHGLGNGGGLYNAEGSLIVTQINFSNNSASRSGGRIYSTGGNLTATECNFLNNAGESGGGIYTTGLSAIVIHCQFINNHARGFIGHGGGLFHSAWGTLIVTQTYFSNKSAGRSGYGGGIYTSGSTFTTTECKFLNNIAGGSSGGIYKRGGNLTTTECNFLNNIASGNGEAMYDTAVLYSSSAVIDCHFRNNKLMLLEIEEQCMCIVLYHTLDPSYNKYCDLIGYEVSILIENHVSSVENHVKLCGKSCKISCLW